MRDIYNFRMREYIEELTKIQMKLKKYDDILSKKYHFPIFH